jgi:hypothetical protein
MRGHGGEFESPTSTTGTWPVTRPFAVRGHSGNRAGPLLVCDRLRVRHGRGAHALTARAPRTLAHRAPSGGRPSPVAGDSQVQLEPDGPSAGALPDAPAAREGRDQLQAAATFGVDAVDAPPQPGWSAVVGDLDAKSAIDDGVGDLERATAVPDGARSSVLVTVSLTAGGPSPGTRSRGPRLR